MSYDKYYTCPEDGEDATLLVDLDTETEPETDEDGNMQYYCTGGGHYFAVDEDGALVY
ncbi:MAG TPA: hypothetical protein VKU38_17145 [Ktedonobacteraceae bacterium]|nr:hypothetical protein [Ktedonobacteraceae bacterium]